MEFKGLTRFVSSSSSCSPVDFACCGDRDE